jgi:hypothetical protein
VIYTFIILFLLYIFYKICSFIFKCFQNYIEEKGDLQAFQKRRLSQENLPINIKKILVREDADRFRTYLRDELTKRDGYKCVNCEIESDLAIDHILPVSRGGTNEPRNLQLLCGRCNSSKGTKTMEEWKHRINRK